MEILTEHWLSIGTGTFLLAMVLYGHYRGFLRIAVTLAALAVSIVVVNVAMPVVNDCLKNNTEIHQTVGRQLLRMAGGTIFDEGQADGFGESPDTSIPSRQREAIEQLKLPEQMKEALLDHNNSEIYRILGVDAFADYIGTYLAGMVLNLVGSVVLFLLVYIGIRFLIRWVDLIAKLPILHGINQLAGAVLGGVQGLLLVWLFFLIVRICADASWSQMFLPQIQESLWLRFLYENNFINWMFIRALRMFV